MRPRSLLWAGGLAVIGSAVGILALAHAPRTPARSARLTSAAPLPAAAATHRSPRRAHAPVAPATTPMASAPGSAGMIVGLDPETGELGMPTTEQMSELQAIEDKTNWSSEGLQVVVHPNGSKSVDVQGRFQDYTVVRTGPDGKLKFDCAQGSAEAKRILGQPVPVDPTTGLEVQ